MLFNNLNPIFCSFFSWNRGCRSGVGTVYISVRCSVPLCSRASVPCHHSKLYLLVLCVPIRTNPYVHQKFDRDPVRSSWTNSRNLDVPRGHHSQVHRARRRRRLRTNQHGIQYFERNFNTLSVSSTHFVSVRIELCTAVVVIDT